MPNWTESMTQSYEYYIVDPGTWKDIRRITNVKSCTVKRKKGSETLGSASFDITESVGECYIRVYLITIQNGVTERFPLGTFIVQTPSSSYDGKVHNITMDAYTPLIELKEKLPPLGYSIFKGENIMSHAYRLVRENARAPVVKTECSTNLYNDFVADINDTWLTYVSDFIANAKYELGLDELGRILFLPKQDTASLQPVWTYDDSNSSILCPDVSIEQDMYGIPNVVEVIYSNGNEKYYARAVNDDVNSPISTVNRGREIIHRVTDPDLIGDPTKKQIDEYAKTLLREMSSLECTISYSHGYNPVRIGDCVLFDYEKADLKNVKAKVISQSIKCDTSCQVTETAVFTKKLWG